MSKQFLSEILTVENSDKSESSEDCIICQEKCGTLSPETGVMELEVRLPCKHTVGSACIAKWLANNNTCPMCRHVFFPRLSRSYTEDETTQDATQDDEIEYEGEELSRVSRMPGENDEDFLDRLSSSSESHDNPRGFVAVYSRPLHLNHPVAFLALSIGDTADDLLSLEESSAKSIAAASIYIASHILGQPRTLAEVALATTTSADTIQSIYEKIYFDRYELIDEDWRRIVGGAANLGEAAEALPSLTWPPRGHDSVNSTENDNAPSALHSLDLVNELCFEFYDVNALHAYEDNFVPIMAQHIAKRMHDTTYASVNWETFNPFVIAAACMYMASYLVFQGKTVEAISAMSGVTSEQIVNTYRVMYSIREEFVQDDWFEGLLWTRNNSIPRLPEA